MLWCQLDVPFCVCTGYRFNDLKPTFGDVALLQKPVDRRVLVAVIRSALSAESGSAKPD